MRWYMSLQVLDPELDLRTVKVKMWRRLKAVLQEEGGHDRPRGGGGGEERRRGGGKGGGGA